VGEGGEGLGGGRIQRKGALEHRTLGPVKLHQGFKAKGAGSFDPKIMKALTKYVLG
jgi:hypothetical protein